jgi:hypothetical protein
MTEATELKIICEERNFPIFQWLRVGNQCARDSRNNAAVQGAGETFQHVSSARRNAEMKTIVASLAIGACLLLPATAFAAGQPASGGDISCGSGSAVNTPGHASSAPGSAFNEPSATSSGGKAGMVYAGSGPGSAHAASGNAVSQYDIACFHVTNQVP